MRTLALIALLLAGMFLHAQSGCDGRYRAVADELEQARDSLQSAGDALYNPVSQLYGMVRMKAIGAVLGLHCTAPELQQLDRIEAALLRKGLALTREQLEAQRSAKQKADWEAALQQFSTNIETLTDSK